MKKIVIFFFSLILAFGHLAAQERKAFSPKDFLEQQEKFITREAQVTYSEATKFFPVFHEMNDKLREKDKEKRTLMRKVRKQKLTEAQYKDVLQQLESIDLEKIKIESSYRKKFLKILSAEKVLKVLDANHRFERQLLKRMLNDKNRGAHHKP